MPKEIRDIKQFLVICGRKDCKSVKIKKNVGNTKFKVRTKTYLYTLVVKDHKKSEKIQQSIPPNITKEVIGKGRRKVTKPAAK
uniref:Large ribosomal subunit protein eL38 n=1 Tax=Euglena gracilis TaxID=3039 RepID=A0A7L5NY24_EUGGR|nr:60S large subunit ribosomal protein eL38 [Euglena gracilis]6ZJ3_Lz Chain Lz, Ribosomal protein eL38 [Euglena gracilis]